ncbi:SPOR domain-containing protein [Tateyamaria sp. SN6-1]|uniref:SPOR domain-containing protein n=1 Tax=Tateyamaria sp. SN6-1 TaxID=3092148 RepID=UPI0039F4C99D
MMRVTRIVALLATVAGFSAGSVHAQTGQVPAEFPPSSFKGTQYVDSRGCVFIRAGIDGNTTWVPRVNRQRAQVCGQTPSLSQTALAAARPAQPVEAPVQITVEPPAAPAPAPAAAPTRATPKPTVQARTAPVPKPAPARVAAPKPAPRVVVAAPKPKPAPVAAPKPAPAPAPKVAQAPVAPVARAQPACRGGTAVSQRYINSGTRYPVRCGPQSAPHSSGAGAVVATNPQATVAATRVSPNARVLPRQVFDKRLQEQDVRVPDGYRPIWTDDRLNPRRAEQSLNGIAQSRLVWTNTVPRRLVDRTTGQDVTAKVALVYPYTDAATQQRDLGTVTLVRRDGQLVKKIQRNRTKARTPVATPAAKPQVAAKPASKAAVKSPQKAVKGQYVQVGTFGVAANAQGTAQKLARAGLPARLGTLKRGGKRYTVVLAGPFASQTGLNNGLRTARALGFADAFVR